jgi:hypothetical protein
MGPRAMCRLAAFVGTACLFKRSVLELREVFSRPLGGTSWLREGGALQKRAALATNPANVEYHVDLGIHVIHAHDRSALAASVNHYVDEHSHMRDVSHKRKAGLQPTRRDSLTKTFRAGFPYIYLRVPELWADPLELR